MFGIIEESKKFILLDSDHDKLRATALMLAKEELLEVDEVSINGEIIKNQGDTHWVPMFDEDTVDEAIKEYADSDIETAYNGDKYLAGNAPAPSKEYQSTQREKAYIDEVDGITAHIQRLRDKEQTEEVVAQIAELIAERDAKVEEIKARFPYQTDPIAE